ncbi:hypothetical protein [Thermus tenuipuniceus]|uniref:hypothetical protein n=1 Tax=Thermus tenuipuniceus TaxID=2078690 RepID=UPI000CF9E9A5|nr:hypothetical protein [Thermus tenuipuniceus]
MPEARDDLKRQAAWLQDFAAVVYSFAARLYGLKGKRKAKRLVKGFWDGAREADGLRSTGVPSWSRCGGRTLKDFPDLLLTLGDRRE